MKNFAKSLLALAAAAMACSMPSTLHAQEIDFGDDDGEFAFDGECDDNRFVGEGMAIFLFEDGTMHDASDCAAAYEAGTISLPSDADAAVDAVLDFGQDGPGIAQTSDLASLDVSVNDIDFGDDNGQWANDDECDDWRFTGSGMTATPLLEDDVRHDASDCRSGFVAGTLSYVGEAGSVNGYDFSSFDGLLEDFEDGPPTADPVALIDSSHIQWGDDEGSYALDGECDDMRFTGAGMTSTMLIPEDVQHDATDCRVAFEQGRLELKR
jgi:hypothetical protein